MDISLIPGSHITASALDAQKARLNLVAQNIANAHTTSGPDGKPYQRQTISFETILDATGAKSVQVSDIRADDTPGKKLYDPAHPDADNEGFVTMPNVNMAVEMVDMMSASRAYEANLSAARTARQMAEKALQIGR